MGPVIEQYAPPSADLVTPSRFAGRLYSPRQVGIATFLGSPMAGCWLLGANFAATDEHERRRNALLAGVAATITLLLVSFMLPENFPSIVLPIASTFVLQDRAKRLQGDRFDEHIARGGGQHSGWRVALVSLLSVAGLVAGAVGLAMLFPESWLGD